LSAIPYALYFNSLEWQISVQDCAELEIVSRAEEIPGVHHDAERWGTFDFRNEVAQELIERGLVNKGIHYRECHRKGMVAECQGAEKHRFAMPYCCDLRFCRFCASRAYIRLLKKHSAVLEYVRTNPRAGYRLRLITLTSLNTGSLSKPVVDAFKRSGKKTLHRLMKGRKGWGALCVDEVGFNNLNLHSHILFYGPYITQDDLRRMWEKVSGFKVVWIEEAEVDGQQALSYMLKYVSKPPSDKPAVLAQLETAFHGARRVFAWGLFYNFKPHNEAKDCADRSCPRCGAELSINRLLRPMSELRAEGLPLLNAVRREKGKDKWVN
jgi:hypothetical protein